MMYIRLNSEMTEADTRRERLKAYISQESISEAEVARRIGRSPSQVSDMLAGRKAFGEKIAREIERKLDLYRGFLDDLPALSPTDLLPTQRRALDLHDRLRHSGRELWFAIGELIAEAPAKAPAKAPKESREILPAVPTTSLPRGSKKVRSA